MPDPYSGRPAGGRSADRRPGGTEPDSPRGAYGGHQPPLDEQPRGGLADDRPPGSTLPEDRPRGDTGVVPGTRRLRNEGHGQGLSLIVGVFLVCALIALLFFVF